MADFEKDGSQDELKSKRNYSRLQGNEGKNDSLQRPIEKGCSL
jgi:hypothetical protein